MLEKVFVERGARPGDEELAAILKKAKPAWDALVAHAAGSGTGEWKFYGEKHGWQWRVAGKKKALLYLIPGPGAFTAALALGEKAVAALPGSGLPAALVAEIQGAKAYAEGRPARVEVKGTAQVDAVKRLIALKLASP